jgi:hypothetical protein
LFTYNHPTFNAGSKLVTVDSLTPNSDKHAAFTDRPRVLRYGVHLSVERAGDRQNVDLFQ